MLTQALILDYMEINPDLLIIQEKDLIQCLKKFAFDKKKLLYFMLLKIFIKENKSYSITMEKVHWMNSRKNTRLLNHDKDYHLAI
jgi:hypothetical protein